MKKIVLVNLCFMMACGVVAAQPPIKDTSFTTYSSYVKEKKRYPQIAIPSYEVPAGVSVTKDVVYKSIGSRPLVADVYAPAKRKKKYPAVLLVFGGGWKSGNKDQWTPFANQLAAQGFVAIAVEYRLSPEAKYPAAIHDLKDAVKWIRANAKRWKINPKKIGVVGASAGGQLASLLGNTNENSNFEPPSSANKYSSTVKAVVNIGGVLAFKHPESAEGKVAAEWLGGTYEEVPSVWEEASPLTHVTSHSAPVLFLNNSQPRFHAGRSDLIKKFNRFGIYSEAYDFPDTPHTFWLFHPWFNEVLTRTTAFLKRFLD